MGLVQIRCNSIKFHYIVLICKMLLNPLALTFKSASVGIEMNGDTVAWKENFSPVLAERLMHFHSYSAEQVFMKQFMKLGSVGARNRGKKTKTHVLKPRHLWVWNIKLEPNILFEPICLLHSLKWIHLLVRTLKIGPLCRWPNNGHL